jgi:hypothetical protein
VIAILWVSGGLIAARQLRGLIRGYAGGGFFLEVARFGCKCKAQYDLRRIWVRCVMHFMQFYARPTALTGSIAPLFNANVQTRRVRKGAGGMDAMRSMARHLSFPPLRPRQLWDFASNGARVTLRNEGAYRRFAWLAIDGCNRRPTNEQARTLALQEL